ncbi:SDR family NAD(P)-dependent oxidoreductase [Marinobacter sp. M1N3S26]|uniref:SDR family NAD(P)-dependent oxidoreductase n=1 Tax=Marinobacter sp. M1N3S26 TaxID=3382299 RepID=UPI00387B8733
MTNLRGKTALVTGGGRGIGSAIVRQLAAEGAAVALTYNRSAEAAEALVDSIRKQGGHALAIRADSRDPEAVAVAVSSAAKELGRLDILVNNAGVLDVAPITDLTLEQYERTMEINTRSVFVASKAAVEQLTDGGRIINIGSNLAAHVPGPGISLYAMSKSALIGLTRGMARDLGDRGITVNLVHPGATNTDMNPADGKTSDLQRSLRAIKTYNNADEVASLVSWLAGPSARSVTGSEFVVDGGANA